MREILEMSDNDIIKDFRFIRALERKFQLIVDEIIDVNTYFIRELNLNPSNDLQGTFVIMANGGILPRDFVEKIAPAVGLRNILVHRYEKIDKNLFVTQARKECDDFMQYIKYISDYLDKN